jgi:hypothetical protein
MVHMRMGVDDILDLIQAKGFCIGQKLARIVCRIDEQSLVGLLISNQIAEHRKISNLVLLHYHLLPPELMRLFLL